MSTDGLPKWPALPPGFTTGHYAEGQPRGDAEHDFNARKIQPAAPYTPFAKQRSRPSGTASDAFQPSQLPAVRALQSLMGAVPSPPGTDPKPQMHEEPRYALPPPSPFEYMIPARKSEDTVGWDDLMAESDDVIAGWHKAHGAIDTKVARNVQYPAYTDIREDFERPSDLARQWLRLEQRHGDSGFEQIPSPFPPPAQNPALIRTSTLPQGIATSSPAASTHVQSFNPYANYLPNSKAILKIVGDLNDMTQAWSNEEIQTGRRLVQFQRNQAGSAITVTFEPVTPEDRIPNSICVSCIWWEEKEGCYITNVDIISLLESLVAIRFTVEEKNRVRRNLEGFRPTTVSKAKANSDEFFMKIMGFPNPKPRNIEKDVKVFPWKYLGSILQKIIGKYSAEYSSPLRSTLPPNFSNTVQSTSSIGNTVQTAAPEPSKKRSRPKIIETLLSKDERESLQEILDNVHDYLQDLEEKSTDPELLDRGIIDAFLELPPKGSYPDYYELIKNPICMKQIETKINRRQYQSVKEFKQDIELLCSNSRRYNGEGSMLYDDANLIESAMLEKLQEETERYPEWELFDSKTSYDSTVRPQSAEELNFEFRGQKRRASQDVEGWDGRTKSRLRSDPRVYGDKGTEPMESIHGNHLVALGSETQEDLAAAEPVCHNCSTTRTPLWRQDPGGNTICNACGLYYKACGEHRPVRISKWETTRQAPVAPATMQQGHQDASKKVRRADLQEGAERYRKIPTQKEMELAKMDNVTDDARYERMLLKKETDFAEFPISQETADDGEVESETQSSLSAVGTPSEASDDLLMCYNEAYTPPAGETMESSSHETNVKGPKDAAQSNSSAEAYDHSPERLIEMEKLICQYFAKELYAGMKATYGATCTLANITNVALVELIRQFSALINVRIVSTLERYAATFISQGCDTVAISFMLAYSNDQITEYGGELDPEAPSFGERIHMLWSGERVESETINTSHNGDEDSTLLPDIGTAVEFLVGGEEYQWLRKQISVAVQTMATGNQYLEVRRKLISAIQDPAEFTYSVLWDAFGFVQAQYDCLDKFDLGSIVCISGTAEIAQAMTCRDYVKMMWPDTGLRVVTELSRFIKESLTFCKGIVLSDPVFEHSTIGRSDNPTNLISQLEVRDNCLYVTAKGTYSEVLELGEVLTWLGAACRASASDSIAYTSPQVSADVNFGSSCSIRYDFKDINDDEFRSADNSTCWLKLFNNPVIAMGYPVRLREQKEPGLEIPLNMAAVLGYAQFATTFNDQFLLKGPCSALLPKLQQGPSIIWHYLVNDDEEPMTYKQALDTQSDCPKLDLFCLEGSRHFIGWTPNVQTLTGTEHAEYDSIGYGGPFIENSGYALSEVVIGGGYKYFTIGGTFIPGKKDHRHCQGSSGPYPLQVRLVGRYNIVLYDVVNQRGWLLDGTSFILHLSNAMTSPLAVRGATLKSMLLCSISQRERWPEHSRRLQQLLPLPSEGDSTDCLQANVLIGTSKARAALSHPSSYFAEDSTALPVEQFVHLDQKSTTPGHATAKEVLLNRQNRNITLFQDLEQGGVSSESDEGAAWRFEDLVVHYCNILDKISEHQNKLQQSQQWKVKNPLATSKTLEGFGFLDILQMEPNLRPRAVKLSPSASHWFKMTENAGAMNILGSNFGDLFQPMVDECERRRLVPCGVDFLAAPVTILKQIAEKRCGLSEGSFQLADDIAWNQPAASFENATCFCKDNQATRAGDIAHTPRHCNIHVTEVGSSHRMWIKSESRGSKSVTIDYTNGAVILGRPSDLIKARVPRKSTSHPVRPHTGSQKRSDKDSHDSGVDVNSIGRSSSSSASN